MVSGGGVLVGVEEANDRLDARGRADGVAGREGVEAWSHAEGKGRVTAATGDYHDAIFNKRSLVVLFHMEITGALSPLARKHLRRLKLRANRDDRTEYGSRAFPTAHVPPGRKAPLGPFVSHWTCRLSSAAVTGNARRASSALAALAAMPRSALAAAACRAGTRGAA